MTGDERFSFNQMRALADLGYSDLQRVAGGSHGMSWELHHASTILSLVRRGYASISATGVVALTRTGKSVRHRLWWHFATAGRGHNPKPAEPRELKRWQVTRGPAAPSCPIGGGA